MRAQNNRSPWFLILVFSVLFAGCAELPENYERSTSFAFPPDEKTRFYQAAVRAVGPELEDSAYLLLGNGLDAFVARAVLARYAEKSIDAQYYLLHNDLVGKLFIDQLLQAADRGVRVRLLVDDMDMAGRDFGTAVLDSHPNIEVRLFNPFGRNTGRFLQYITGFGEQTRRAHNKSFTVDSITTIIGGRNIGNEYFVADPGMAFIDLDVMAVGPAATLVDGSFDIYWNDELSYPISLLVDTPPTPEQVAERTRAFKDFIAEQQDSVYVKELQHSRLAEALHDYSVELLPGKGQVVWDHPSKLASYDEDSDMMLRDLMPHLNSVEKELVIISPYFVPGKEGTAFFRKLRDRGVRVAILTNALSSTDVAVVHAGYANYRKKLLDMGVELYELNRDLPDDGRDYKDWKFYKSKASLHSKCFVIDRQKTFIGSLNLDPRSVIHNTEIGMIIDSAEIAGQITSFMDEEMEKIAFRLELVPGSAGSKHIRWHGVVDGEQTTLNKEPYSGFWQRFTLGLMRLLPIESQL